MRLRNVSPRGDLNVAHHGHVPFGAEFDVLEEHLAGLVHQAFGDDKNFEPADGEAQSAVEDAQKPPADPEPPAEAPAEEPAPEAPAEPTAPAEDPTPEESN